MSLFGAKKIREPTRTPRDERADRKMRAVEAQAAALLAYIEHNLSSKTDTLDAMIEEHSERKQANLVPNGKTNHDEKE